MLRWCEARHRHDPGVRVCDRRFVVTEGPVPGNQLAGGGRLLRRIGAWLVLAMSLTLLSGCAEADSGLEPPGVMREPVHTKPEAGMEVPRAVPYANSQQPVMVRIPALDVRGPLQPVGMTDDLTMQVPADIDVIGWFDRSVVPVATRGNTVMVGHRDGVDDPNGVFRRLGELVPGDRIHLDDQAGRGLEYVVSEVDLLGRSQFAAEAEGLFAADGPHRLVLLTCGGEYDRSRGGYQANVVVIATRA